MTPLTQVGSRHLHVAEDGQTSLVELAVVIGLLMVVLTAMWASLDLSSSSSKAASQGFDAIGQAQAAVDEVSKDLRAAVIPQTGSPAFVTATTTSSEFYVSEGQGNVNGPEQVSVSLSGSSLTRTASNPNPPPAPPLTYPPTPSTSNLLASDVVAGSTIFTYYDQNDNLITPGAGNALTTPQLSQVGYVKVSIMTSDASSAPSTTVTSTILIRNLYYTWTLQ